MPTNDERREVAENLRSMCSRGCRYAEQFYELLNETVMREWDFHSFQDVADRLADLIEPEERTCRNTSEAVVKGPFTCSACGEHSKTWYHMGFGDMYADVPKFCPNCGARVVKEDAE